MKAHPPIILFYLLLLSAFGIHAQEPSDAPVPFAGYHGLAWGSSTADVKRLATGDLDSVVTVIPESWNEGPLAAFTGFSMGPEAVRIRYQDRNGQVTDYFFVQDRLCMVIENPDYQDKFRPQRVIRDVEKIYDAPIWKSEVKDLTLPPEWGILSETNEQLLTLQWENETGRVRMAIKKWPPSDLRQVFRVVYLSKTLSDENLGRLEAFRKKEAEDAVRRQQEAEAAKIKAEAARKAAAAATP
jgi:hypothetical protein